MSFDFTTLLSKLSDPSCNNIFPAAALEIAVSESPERVDEPPPTESAYAFTAADVGIVVSLLFDAIVSDCVTIAAAVKSATSRFVIELPVPFASIVLLVNVVVELAVTAISLVRATVPVASGNVIVLSAVGSVTVSVVSKSSAVAPSRTIEASERVSPEIEGLVRVLFVSV